MLPPRLRYAAFAIAILTAAWFAPPRHARGAAVDSLGAVVPTGSMLEPRFDHTATLLPGGKVLIAAGMARNGLTEPTAELYDSRSGRFTFAGKLASPRGWGPTATLLRNGQVLIAGGASGSWCSDSCYLATAELYDPSAHSFTLIGNMTRPRAGAASILLPDGDVLIVGGDLPSDHAPASTAELYHPSTRAFSATGSPSSGAASLLLLSNGSVLALNDSGAEIYHPSTGRFTPAGKFPVVHGKFGAALLPDGNVMVAGGQVGGGRGSEIDTTVIYEPGVDRFLPGPRMNFARYKLKQALVRLRDGRILIAGGASRPELYDPVSRSFQPARGSTLDGYCFSTATPLPDGDVLLAGGYNTSTWIAVNHAWLFRP